MSGNYKFLFSSFALQLNVMTVILT